MRARGFARVRRSRAPHAGAGARHLAVPDSIGGFTTFRISEFTDRVPSLAAHLEAYAERQRLPMNRKGEADVPVQAGHNESTMYVELDLLFAEHARLLRRGGRHVAITGCYNDTYGRASREVSLINAHYICDIHPRSEYFRAMARNRLVPVHVQDLAQDTIPYWAMRRQADHLVTGIEDTFLTAYLNAGFQYLLIAADRV